MAAGTALAAPSVPQDDSELLERLPSRADTRGERARQRAVQQLLRQQPRDIAVALPAAREAIERSRRYADPRELGTAQAWLKPWWDDTRAPGAARLLKAVVLQARHEFDPALAELDRLVNEPFLAADVRAQAELTRAGVLQVRGRWDEARAGCQRLAGGRAPVPHGEVCLAELDSLQGKADDAQRRLIKLDRIAAAPHEWIALLRAELAERQGLAEAGALYASALNMRDDVYTRAAYADWLLAQGQAAKAAASLQPAGGPGVNTSMDTLPDALVLRLAIAWRRSAHAQAALPAQEMQRRFDAAAARNDDTHGRERALFALDVQADAAQALKHALSNWAQQKEPADALLLLRAAKAAGRPTEAEPVRQFMRSQSMSDVRMKGL